MVFGLVSFATASGASDTAIRIAVARGHSISSPFPSQARVQKPGADDFGAKHLPVLRIEDPDLLIQNPTLQADNPDRNPHAAVIQNQHCRLSFFRERSARLESLSALRRIQTSPRLQPAMPFLP